MKYLTTLSLMILLAVFTLASCSNHSQLDFKLIILKQEWGQLKIGYASEPAQTLLKSVDSSDPLFTVNIELVEKYDWNLQTITLTQQGTDQLIKALTSLEDTDSDEVTQLQEMKKNLGWGNPVENVLYNHAFIIQADNQFRYGGIFLDALSQMPIDYPVIRVTISNSKVVLALLPTHIPFVMTDPIDGNGNLRDLAISQDAERDVQQLDFFSSWTAGLATSESSIKFRAVIRDEAIKRILETANKIEE